MTDGEILARCIVIVREAGRVARARFGATELVKEKPLGDIVTAADLEIEELILRELRQSFPDFGFLSEERGEERHGADNVWILDPIDGTKYFWRGVPLYTISLALERDGELVMGVVFNPQADEMFAACLGGGATRNGTPIHVSAVGKIEDAMISAEIASRDHDAGHVDWALEHFGRLVRTVKRVRLLGVSALALCYCAEGGFDAYLNLGSSTEYYDVAAGSFILTEAGGRFIRSGGAIIGGPNVLVEQLESFLRQ